MLTWNPSGFTHAPYHMTEQRLTEVVLMKPLFTITSRQGRLDEPLERQRCAVITEAESRSDLIGQKIFPFQKHLNISSLNGIQNCLENNHKPPQKKHRVAGNDLALEEQLLYCKTHNEKY